MNKPKLLALGAGIALLAAGVGSFKHDKFTIWTDERIDPYTLKSVCKETTYISLFGKMSMKEGPALPEANCVESVNYWLTETVNDGCSVDKQQLVAKCDEAYEYPFY